MPNDPVHAIPLPSDWYRYVVADGVDTNLPGIYEWLIEGVGSYIGKYTLINRPTKAYGRHVQNILNRRAAYRRSNPNGYRRVHYELEKAHREGRAITLIILENVDKSQINGRERELIRERGVLNGGRWRIRTESSREGCSSAGLGSG